MARNKPWLRRLAFAVAALLILDGGATLAMRARRIHDALQWRLEQAFGRPVEVSRFGLSLWSGLRVEAHYITVGEDPRFGNEFFLRADQLTAGPDWRALLRGRVRFKRFSFQRPSLNLVVVPGGQWNFESWVVSRSAMSARPAAPARVSSLPGEIVVEDGRINLKRSADKLPFSFVGVRGRLAPDSAGRWSVSLEAQPLRAGVTLQDAGTLRFEGTLPQAGVSLTEMGQAVPSVQAEYSLAWQKASLSGALRLLFGEDFGVRGSFDGALSGRGRRPGDGTSLSSPSSGPGAPAEGATPDTPARREDSSRWQFTAELRLNNVHRWDLPLQAGLPGLNLTVEGDASADRTDWEFRRIALEAPRSNLRGSGTLVRGSSTQASLRVVSSSIHLDDLLAWYRAFHAGVAPGTVLQGYLGVDVALEGWPLAIVRGTVATTGARLRLQDGKSGLEFSRAVIEAGPGGASLEEMKILLGEDDTGLRLSGRVAANAPFSFDVALSGGTQHLENLSAAAAALALMPPAAEGRGFRASGAASVRLDWKGTARPWRVDTRGTAGLENATLLGGVLRDAVEVGKLKMDFLPRERRIQIASARAFGAQWSGALHASTFAGPWDFSLTAGRLDPASVLHGFAGDLAESSSFLSRMLPAQAAATVARVEPQWPAWLSGTGTLAIGTLEVGRLELERVKGRLTVGVRELLFENAEASFFGGRARGEARGDFGEQPLYVVRARIEDVNLAALTAVFTTARQCCAGMASGPVTLSAKGWSREALLASMEGTGHADLRSAALLGLDLPASLAQSATRPGRTALRTGRATFSFGSGKLQLESLVLGLPSSVLAGKGSVSYRGELDLELAPDAGDGDAATPESPSRKFHVTGTLAAPQIAVAKKPAP
jgi:hypothetical protein